MDEITNTTLQHLLDVCKLPKRPLVKMAAVTIFEKLQTCDKSRNYMEYLQDHNMITLLCDFLNTNSDYQVEVENLLTAMSMRVIFKLSCRSILVIPSMKTDSFFEFLLMFLNIDGPFFHYRKQFTDIFIHITMRKQITAEIVEEKLSVEKRRTLLQRKVMHHSLLLPKVIARCICFATVDGEEDVNVNKYLISKDLAWYKESRIPETMYEKKELIITEVLPEGFFYAVIGKTAVENVKKISCLLEEYKSQLNPSVYLESGKIVVVDIQRDDVCKQARGQVLSVHGMWSKVMLIDFGNIEDVQTPNVFELPSVLGLMYYPQQITLCCLDCIQVPPSNPDVTQMALATMCNIFLHDARASLPFIKVDGLKHVINIAQCPDPKLVIQAVRVLNNLTRTCCTDKSLLGAVIPILLCVLKYLHRTDFSQGLVQDATHGILSCLTNILYINNYLRTIFYQNEGMSIVLHSMKRYHSNTAAFIAGMQLLRNFLFVPSYINMIKVPVKDDYSEDTSVLKNILKGTATSLETVVDSSDEEVVIPNSFPMSGVTNIQDVAAKGDVKSQYLLNGAVDFSSDMTHELVTHATLSEVSAVTTAQVVCGMINSKGGTIYFGISKNHRFCGIQATNDDRDCFRQGIDRLIMDKLTPSLLHVQYDLVYMPVHARDGSNLLTKIPNLHVAELAIYPSKGSLHTVEGICYYRFGPNTLALSVKEVRELVVVTEEEHYKEEIISLQKQINRMTSSGGNKTRQKSP